MNKIFKLIHSPILPHNIHEQVLLVSDFTSYFTLGPTNKSVDTRLSGCMIYASEENETMYVFAEMFSGSQNIH